MPSLRGRLGTVAAGVAALAASCGYPDYSGFDRTPGAAGGGAAGASGAGGGGGVPADAADAESGKADADGEAAAGPCKTDADCKGNPAGAYCDVPSGKCAACKPADDKCPWGTWCNPKKLACEFGCRTSADCVPPEGGLPEGGTADGAATDGAATDAAAEGEAGSSAATPYCDTANHKCVECLADAQCAAGAICKQGACTPGCNAGHPCPGALKCCSGACSDVQADPQNCGDCGSPCPKPAHSTAACSGGLCGIGPCDPGWADCDAKVATGCEADLQGEVANCGGCGKVCKAVNGTPSCAQGKCSIACNSGWGDCNQDGGDGCEADLTSNVDHCGKCGGACPSCAGARVCAGGLCAGGTVYFTDGFSDNSKGWVVGQDWEIGKAKVSSGQTLGFPDPASDHTPDSTDDGVAGTILGGNLPKTVHPAYYLVSPQINLLAATTAKLTFWRWLNVPAASSVPVAVEVFNANTNPATWTAIQTPNQTAAVTDDKWSQQVFDVTQYKSGVFRIRLSYTVNTTTFPTVSGWNIDDLTVSSANCP